MARRFDRYRVKTGDLIDETFLNSRFLDLDVRVADTEERALDWSTEAAKLRESGLARVAEALDPVVQEISARANLGAILAATSETDIDVSLGTKVLEIKASERAQFAPAAHLSIFKTDDPTIGMLGRTIGYDPTTGMLQVFVNQVIGSGFHTAWSISVANSTDTLTQAQIATAKANDASDAAGVAVINRDEAVAAAEQSIFAKVDAEGAAEAAFHHLTDTAQARDQAAIFMQRYQGAHATNPAVRLDGSALQLGDWYLNTASFGGEGDWRWWTGTAWRSRQVPSDGTVVSFEGRAGAVNAQDGDYHAGEIVFSPAGSIAATRVQAALIELDNEKQAISALLTSVAAIATNGILAKTGAGTAVARTIVGTANEITVVNGDAVAGNPTFALVKPSQAEAEAGLDANKPMNALRTAQAIAVQVPAATVAVAGRTRLATEAEGLAGIEVSRTPSVYVVKKMLDQLRDQVTAGAGAALDTFDELAAALGDDPNFATTVMTAIGTKLPASAVSSFIMTLLDDADPGAARGTLGLGALAVLASVGTASLDTDAVTNAKLANMAANTIKGASAAGDPQDLTPAQVRTILSLGALALKSTIVTTDISDGQVTFAKMALGTIREKLTADRTYYVRTDGVDSNEGLADTSGGAFLTGAAAMLAASKIDFNGYVVTIQFGAGTFAGRVIPYGMVGQLIPDQLLINGVGASTIITASSPYAGTVASAYGGMAKLSNATVINTSSLGFGVQALDGGALKLGAGLTFGASGQAPIGTQSNGFISVTAPFTVTANCQYIMRAADSSIIQVSGSGVIALGTRTVTSTVAVFDLGRVTFQSLTWSGTVTGRRYEANGNGVIETYGAGESAFPGSVAGVKLTGGQYG